MPILSICLCFPFLEVLFPKRPTVVKRKHSSRMRSAHLPTVHVLVAAIRCQYQGGYHWSHVHWHGYPHLPSGINTPWKYTHSWDTHPLPLWDPPPRHTHPPPVDRISDTYKNITFPQLLLQAVIKAYNQPEIVKFRSCTCQT